MHNSIQNSKILLVDDDLANLNLLEAVLAKYGYQNVVAISDPRNVLDEYQKGRIDLILLDLNMPQMTGFEVMQQLNQLDDPLLPPVVVLTAQTDQGALLQALNTGARDYITKPFGMEELRARVQNMLEMQSAHKSLYAQKENLDGMVREKTAEVLHTRLQIVQRLARAAEYRDNDTGRHVLRVSHSAVRLAEELGWSAKDLENLLHASPLHDVGKIGVPDAILLKPDKLNQSEWEIMKTHASIGAEILCGDNSSLLSLACEIALTHHEKWDGSGYPAGLERDAIPVSGRIVAVVDVFDALTSKRPYKRAWNTEDAAQLIRDGAGSQFDPEIVNIFDRALPDITEIREHFSDNADGESSSEPKPVEYL